MDQKSILILDFGSQYTQLIARRIRELNVYCEIFPYNNLPKINKNINGIILSGSPFSVRDDHSPKIDLELIQNDIPVLGICYGAQYLAYKKGGDVLPSTIREYGRAELILNNNKSTLFKNISNKSEVWMSHGDTINYIPSNFEILASTPDVKIAAYKLLNEEVYGLQFHPEVYHSEEGEQLIKNFVVDICGCSQDWTPASFIQSTVSDLKQKLSDDKVVLGLSGGVDSTVAAVILHRAIGKQLYCVFVDNGLLRKKEFEEVMSQWN